MACDWTGPNTLALLMKDFRRLKLDLRIERLRVADTAGICAEPIVLDGDSFRSGSSNVMRARGAGCTVGALSDCDTSRPPLVSDDLISVVVCGIDAAVACPDAVEVLPEGSDATMASESRAAIVSARIAVSGNFALFGVGAAV